MKAKKISRAWPGMIAATRLYLAAFPSVNALIYQPPHPWGASDGPAMASPLLICFLHHCSTFSRLRQFRRLLCGAMSSLCTTVTLLHQTSLTTVASMAITSSNNHVTYRYNKSVNS